MKPENVTGFLKNLEVLLAEAANADTAEGQKAYMRHQFNFHGIKTPVRRGIQKILFQKDKIPLKQDLSNIVKALWEKSQRENQYIAQELANRYTRSLEPEDITLYEYMITHKSWWDTVDFIAINLVGAYFKVFPEKRDEITARWMSSGNIWLQRSVLLFQLKYRDSLDTAFLSRVIFQLLGSEEFFINKAIGWILREYSKTNGVWVKQFVEGTSLPPLSKREALRLLKN